MNDAEYALVEEVIQKSRDGRSDEVLGMFGETPWLVESLYPPQHHLLHQVAWRGRDSEPVIKYMLEHGVDPNVLDSGGQTALHHVVHRPLDTRSDGLKIIALLLEHGANINHHDKWDCTPLHEAAKTSWEEAVRFLIVRGADINAKILGGETALDVVYSMGLLGGRSLAHWMKKQGAISGKSKRSKPSSLRRS